MVADRLIHKVYLLHNDRARFGASLTPAERTLADMEQQSNLAPIVLGVLYLGSHWSLMVSFFCQLELGTLATHSDFNIPYLHNSLVHDWHHYACTSTHALFQL